jgi:hypothetical protein
MPDLQDRVARVRLLLETLNDPYPTPQGALRSDSGPAASRYVPCETCRTRGRVRSRSAFILCLICDGVGWRPREPRDVEWDAYVGLPVEEAAQLSVMGLGSRTAEPEQDPPYFWERLRSSYDRHGSYKEVRLRLDQLSRVQPRRYRLVRAVLVDKEPRRLTEPDEVHLALGVVEIALRMRSVRVPPWIIERSAAAERRSTVEALAADGYSAGEIARRTGLTKEAVRRRMRRSGAIRSGHAGIPAAAM